jgi:hypothetical protein
LLQVNFFYNPKYDFEIFLVLDDSDFFEGSALTISKVFSDVVDAGNVSSMVDNGEPFVFTAAHSAEKFVRCQPKENRLHQCKPRPNLPHETRRQSNQMIRHTTQIYIFFFLHVRLQLAAALDNFPRITWPV